MASEFVVVGTYDVDIAQFEAKVDEVTAGYSEMDAASKAAAKGTQQLSGSVGSLADKFGVLAEEEKRAAEASKELTDTTTKSVGVFGRAGNAIKQFTLGARDGFKTAIKEVGGFRGLGGPFLTLPRLAVDDQGLVVTEGERVWRLSADAFGATLMPLRAAPAPELAI